MSARGVGVLALELLGRQVLRRADDPARLGLARRQALLRPGDAEVHQLGVAGLVDDQVLGLDVAVDHALPCAAPRPAQSCLARRSAAEYGRRPFAIEQVAQRHAAHVLHRDVGQPVHLPEVEGAQHVRVGDAARQLELALQALEQRRRRSPSPSSAS
jgi:hypothetical protein